MISPHWPVSFAIAHRGASQLAPENTLAALDIASHYHAQWVECDVMLSSDLQPMVIHDWTLDRTTNGFGFVARTSYAKIRSLDAGSWFDNNYNNQRVPTLSELFARCAALKIGLNVELKALTRNRAHATASAVLTELRRHPYFTSSNVLLSSSNQACVAELFESDAYPLAFISHQRLSEQQLLTLSRKKIVSVHFLHSVLDQAYVALVHAQQMRVLAYTVNELQRVAELKTMDVDGIFTDNANLYS